MLWGKILKFFDYEMIIEITFEQMMYYGSIFTLDTELLIQERKRPRKLSHRVLECTIEEVSAAPIKKRVSLDKDGSGGVH